jgi:transglutaminase/protease-like cytokinesis protein 3
MFKFGKSKLYKPAIALIHIMNRHLIPFLFLFVPVFLFGQTDWTKYDEVLKFNSNDPVELAQKLTAPFITEREKIEAIYYWITNNVKYDIRSIEDRKKQQPRNHTQRMSREEYDARLKKEINTTLKHKKGVCQNYALTFQSLCQAVDIECEFIGGWSRTNPSSIGKLGERHAWNAVRLDGKWEYVDPTYGSGYVNEKTKFVFSFEPNCLFMDRESFNLFHFPKDKKWQLTEEPISEETYKQYPIVGRGFISYDLKDLQPIRHTIEVKRGKPLQISFRTKNAIPDIKCISRKTRNPVEMDIDRKDDLNVLTLDTKKIRSGLYSIRTNSKTILIYKIVLK